MTVSFVVVAYTWKRNLSVLNEHISLGTALKINGLATIPKYAPGKVWGIVGKIYLAKKEGISEHISVITISLETILSLLSGVILFLFVGASVLKKSNIPYIYYILLIPICFIITYPKILIRLTNFLLKIFKRPLIDTMPTYLQILELLFLYGFGWVLQGVGIVLLMKSFYPISMNHFLLISGVNAFSFVVGFASLITPAGLGIKEGVLSYLLVSSLAIPSAIAILISLIIRLWGTVGEVLYFLIYLKNLKKYL
jgi:uncharacterized membrane protein YbhN (UPF0104 family)